MGKLSEKIENRLYKNFASNMNTRLSTKIFVPLLMIMVVGYILIIFFTNYFFTIAFEKDVEEKMFTIADQVKTRIDYSSHDMSAEQLIDQLYDYNKFSNYAELVLFDEKFQPLYTNTMDYYNQFFLRDFIEIANFMPTTLGHNEVQHLHYIGETYFIYSVAVMNSDIPDVAYIGLAKEMGVYDQLNRILLGIMVVITAFVVLASIYAISLITRLIARPIGELATYAKGIEENKLIDFQPSKISREIYSLGDNVVKMSNRLQQANQEQKLFFDNASHELKTPLMIIKGYAEAIEQGFCADDKEAAQLIVQESDRLNHIVADLLILAKFDRGDSFQSAAEINLNEFLQQIIKAVQPINTREIQIVLTVSEEINISANEEVLRRIFLNPLSNSLRYAATKIEITGFLENGHLCVEISDDGGGISDEILANLFTRFYKGHDGNVGLGMPIMKSAVESLGGTIQVFNRGAGTVIKVLF